MKDIFVCHQRDELSTGEYFFWEKFQKMGFSKKWGWCAQYRSLPFSGLVCLGTAHIFIMVHFLPRDLHQSERRKKPHFGTFPDLWRHSRVRRPHLIRNLAYRSNETFFSRTHRFGCELQTSDAGWYSKLQKDNNSAAHVRNGMVYLTVPLDRLPAHCVQSWCDARPASRMIIIWTIWYTSSCCDGTENS